MASKGKIHTNCPQVSVTCLQSLTLQIAFFRQDSSAIHVIPRVSVVRQHHSDDDRHAFLLKVANPTLGTVRLRLAESSYRGESDCWGEDDGTTSCFSGLLVDTLTQKFVDTAQLQPTKASLGTSETVELLSAEDSIIELGGKARGTPEPVDHWEHPVLETAGLRLVAKSASDAWFELVVVNNDTTAVTQMIPLALQVDLGDGSWESSLVPVAEGKDGDNVTFDLVLAWF